MAEADLGSNWPLPDEITREIFALALCNNPLHLFQVACSCKDWFRALSHRDFAHSLANRNVPPQLLGFIHNHHDQRLPTFVPTLWSPFVHIKVPDRGEWKILDYRNGRGLFVSQSPDDLGRRELLVWDASTGARRRVPLPPQATHSMCPGAALVCAVPGCTHLAGCSDGEFRILLLFSFLQYDDDIEDEINCYVYSSAADEWVEEAKLVGLTDEFGSRPPVLAGGDLYILSDNLVLYHLDTDSRTLKEMELPDKEESYSDHEDNLILMVTKEGQLGLVETTGGNIFSWLWRVDGNGKGRWKNKLTLDHYFTTGTVGEYGISLLGFAEGTDIFFVSSSKGLFSFELPSKNVNDVDELNVIRLQVNQEISYVCPVVTYNAIQRQLNNLIQHNPDEAQAAADIQEPADDEQQVEEPAEPSPKRYKKAADGHAQDLGMHSSAEPDC